jgi:hypothetical protein
MILLWIDAISVLSKHKLELSRISSMLGMKSEPLFSVRFKLI